MVKLGVLGLNDGYNNEDWYIKNFDYKNVKDHIIDFSQFNLISKDELFNVIGTIIQPDDSCMMNITDLYYDKDYVLQSLG